MTTRRNFLKLALAAPIAGVMAKLGVVAVEARSAAAAVASRVNGYYTGMYLVVARGAGAEQMRVITGYSGTTHTATMGWSTPPDANSQIVLLRGDQIDPAGADMKFNA
jgi:hypothetical protein